MLKNQVKKIIVGLVSTILFVINFTFMIVSIPAYANEVVEVDGFTMCKLTNGEYAKDTWCWVDTNKDSIAECYRFDSYGHIEANYKSEDGRETNDKGQLIENGFVIEKMLSNGNVKYGEGVPFVDVKTITKDTKSKFYESPQIKQVDYGGQILTTKIDENFIGPVAPAISGKVIYSGSSNTSTITTKISTYGNVTKKSTNLVAGKNIDKYITTKNSCKTDVDDVIIYGGNTIWDDCIELHGTGASVKFNLKNNNYIYFEVAEAPHADDEKDINIRLEMYVDNELYETLDEFVADNYQIFSEDLEETNKVVELKVKSDISTSRRVYIHNGKVKKIKEDED